MTLDEPTHSFLCTALTTQGKVPRTATTTGEKTGGLSIEVTMMISRETMTEATDAAVARVEGQPKNTRLARTCE